MDHSDKAALGRRMTKGRRRDVKKLQEVNFIREVKYTT